MYRQALILSILALFCTTIFQQGIANAVSITNIRFCTYPDHTRVVLDCTSLPKYKVWEEEDPPCLVLTLINGVNKTGKKGVEIEDGVVKTIEFFPKGEVMQLRMSLERTTNYNIFKVRRRRYSSGFYRPDRLVIDVSRKKKVSEIPKTEVKIGNMVLSVPSVVKQGQVALLTLDPGDEKVESIQGRFLGRDLHFFEAQDGGYACLAPVCLFEKPKKEVPVWFEVILSGGKRENVFEEIEVLDGGFQTEYLTLPPGKVTLSKKDLARVRKEKIELDRIWAEESPSRLWRGGFIIPVKGRPGSGFGLRRVINNEPRSPHTGIDIKAPAGTKVLASNHGVVRFIGDLFFSGNSVVIDHGLGLYTMYFHLSKVLVKEGEKIKKGQVIGLVGATGRATGPHMHFGARLQGARVNPHDLFSIPDKY